MTDLNFIYWGFLKMDRLRHQLLSLDTSTFLHMPCWWIRHKAMNTNVAKISAVSEWAAYFLPVFWYYYSGRVCFYLGQTIKVCVSGLMGVKGKFNHLPPVRPDHFLRSERQKLYITDFPSLILHRYHKDIIIICISSTDMKVMVMVATPQVFCAFELAWQYN